MKKLNWSRLFAQVGILGVTAVSLAAGTAGTASAAANSAGSGTPVTASAATPAAMLADGVAAATLGVITGVVRGISGGLAGVCVTATGPSGTVPGLTKAGGRYVITGLRTGEYTLGYSDCAHPAQYFDQWYGNSDIAATATKVLVTPGHPVRLTPATLRPTSPLAASTATRHALGASSVTPADGYDTIYGTVRTKSGKPLSGMCVSSETFSNVDGLAGDGTNTGRRGGYELPIGSAGKWTVLFTSGGCGSSKNYAPQWWRYTTSRKKATRLTAGKGRNFHGIDASLVPGAAISGVVRAASGTRPALAGVCVTAAGLGSLRDVEQRAITRGNGSYVLKGLGTGRFQVRFEPGCGQRGNYLSATYKRTVSVTDGKTKPGINGSLPTGAKISGVVTSQAGAAPLAGVCVLLQSNGGTSREQASHQDGSYSFGRLRPGRYTVAFTGGCGNSGSFAPQFYDAQANQFGSTPVTITAGQPLSGVDAAMLAGGTITGEVTTTAGTGLRGVCVYVDSPNVAAGLDGTALQFPAGTIPIGPVGLAIDYTGRTGHYTIANLAPGLYSAQFAGGCGGGTGSYESRAFAPQGATWVSVNAGTVTAGVSSVLRKGGTISGVVTGAGGRALSGICVQAASVSQPASPLFSLLNQPGTRHGSYRITGLAAGRYTVSFSACNGQPYASQWYKGKSSSASARAVVVRDGHTTAHINAALISGGTISGQIRSGISGKPVAGACVLALDSAGDVLTEVTSGKSGSYRVPHLAAGRVTLEPLLCDSLNPKLAGIMRRGIKVHDGATTTARFTLPTAGRISGTVLGGSPVAAEPGLCVEAAPKTGDGLTGWALTGANGSYTLPGLAAGSYRVLFTPLCLFGTAAVAPQWFNGQSTRGAAAPVTVTAGQTATDVGGTLATDGGISGTVTSATSAPAAGVCVGAYTGSSGTPAALAITGADGSYQLGSLLPGSYSIEFSSGCGAASYATQWYDDVASRATATPVTVTSGTITTGIDAS